MWDETVSLWQESSKKRYKSVKKRFQGHRRGWKVSWPISERKEEKDSNITEIHTPAETIRTGINTTEKVFWMNTVDNTNEKKVKWKESIVKIFRGMMINMEDMYKGYKHRYKG